MLHSLSGGEVSFDDVISDLPSLPRLDSTGNLTFRIGGRLTVSGDADGDYRGDLPINADYLCESPTDRPNAPLTMIRREAVSG